MYEPVAARLAQQVYRVLRKGADLTFLSRKQKSRSRASVCAQRRWWYATVAGPAVRANDRKLFLRGYDHHRCDHRLFVFVIEAASTAFARQAGA